MVKGRKPQSTDVKQAIGATRRINKHPPTVKKGYPDKPKHIADNEIASAYWDTTCYHLDEMKLLAESDGAAIEMFVEAMAVKQKLFASGNVIALHKQGDLCLRMAAELGLTPSSRTRMVAKTPEEEDAFTQWQKGIYASDN